LTPLLLVKVAPAVALDAVASPRPAPVIAGEREFHSFGEADFPDPFRHVTSVSLGPGWSGNFAVGPIPRIPVTVMLLR
jgi:hypothetical protein